VFVSLSDLRATRELFDCLVEVWLKLYLLSYGTGRVSCRINVQSWYCIIYVRVSTRRVINIIRLSILLTRVTGPPVGSGSVRRERTYRTVPALPLGWGSARATLYTRHALRLRLPGFPRSVRRGALSVPHTLDTHAVYCAVMCGVRGPARLRRQGAGRGVRRFTFDSTERVAVQPRAGARAEGTNVRSPHSPEGQPPLACITVALFSAKVGGDT
jgi:hypothetical protein